MDAREPFALYGMQPVQDPETARLSKHVICLGITTGVFAIGKGIMDLATPAPPGTPGGLGSREAMIVLGIALALLVPACGYFGAKREDSNLVGCFSCFNCLSCCCTLFGTTTILMAFVFYSALVHHCAPHSQTSSCPEGFRWSQVCEKIPEHSGDSDWACYHHMENTLDDMKSSFPWFFVLSVSNCILGFCSCFAGYRLYGKLTGPQPILAPPVQVNMQQQAIQPHPQVNAH